MRLHTIYITKNCNMNCSYCYERTKEKENLNKETVNKILNHIYNDVGQIYIEIIGGEPLLNWHVFLEICKYNAQRERLITTTTNGILLTKAKISQLKKYGIKVGISYDGKSSHNVYRKDNCGFGTEQRVRNSILTALNMELEIIVNLTFQKANASYIYDDIIDLVNCGVKSFKINTVNNNLFKTDKNIRYFVYDRLTRLSKERNILIDLKRNISNSPCDHFYYFNDIVKCVKKGMLGTWEAVAWT